MQSLLTKQLCEKVHQDSKLIEKSDNAMHVILTLQFHRKWISHFVQLSPPEVEKDMNAIMQVLIKDAMNDA